MSKTKKSLKTVLAGVDVEVSYIVLSDEVEDDETGEDVPCQLFSAPALNIAEQDALRIVDQVKQAVTDDGTYTYHSHEIGDFIIIRFV